MDTNEMRFRADGTFHILQVSDPQDTVWPRKAMLRMLARAYDSLCPDLVLFTGDNTLGNHLHDIGLIPVHGVHDPARTLARMRRALAHILAPVQSRGIPFAMIYGNHDDMNDVSKEEQFKLYRTYSCCLPMNENDPAVDCDTYSIPIRAQDGRTAWNLYLLDSAWNDGQGQHCRIKAETVQWYTRTSAKLRAENGGAVPSLLFLHVPLPQTKRLCRPCAADYPGAVRDGSGHVCLDPARARGVLGESISACEDPHGLFEAIRASGDVRAVVSGHDHLNCFEGEWDGVRFLQSSAASFRCYGGRMRGVRLFVLHADDPDRFETHYFTYNELCGTDLKAEARYFWDADDKIYEKYAALGAAALAGTAAAAAALHKRLKAN